MPQLTDALRQEYVELLQSCQCQPEQRAEVLNVAKGMVMNQWHYDVVSAATGVPWFLIAALHSMEADCSFKCHLHNGDPLTKRTIHVPAGRPVNGKPPFKWEDSALDALRYDKLDQWHDWSASGCLYRAELFNGWGYRSRGVRSPYLWAGSQHEQPGRFISDSVFDATATSDQVGVGTVLHVLLYLKKITIEMR